MKTFYSIVQKNSESQYDVKKVGQLVVKIKRSSKKESIENLKLELFILNSKVILKAINNYFFLVKDIKQERILHTKEDICSECYLIFTNCINSLNISNLKKFYFYLNTSLNRGVYRIYEKNYKKHFPVLDSSDNSSNILENKSYSHSFDEMISIDLKNFTEEEIDFIKFKISGQKVSLYLKKINISTSRLYEINESVIKKLSSLYSNDEDLKKYFK